MTVLKMIACASVILVGLSATSTKAQDHAKDPDQLRSKPNIQQIDTSQTRELNEYLDQYSDFGSQSVDVTDSINTNDRDPIGRHDHDKKNTVYGGTLMSAEERTTYRELLINAKTPEERERILHKHRREIQNRARALGVPTPKD